MKRALLIQKYLIIANGANGYLLVVDRASGQVLSMFGRLR